MLVWLAVTALASDCDVGALKKDLAEASPIAVARAWSALAACDAAEAKKEAPSALGRMIAEKEAYEAALTATGMGSHADVRAWITKLEPQHKSEAVAHIGNACAREPGAEAFFLDTAKVTGAAFWSDRWFRGLAGCRSPGAQALLAAEVDARATAGEPARFKDVLEAYARNLRGEALPKLVALGGSLEAEERLVYVVSAFGDAANVGSEAGLDVEVAGKAAEAIVALAPTLPPRAVDNARGILLALGAESAAHAMAGQRWRERLSGGAYTYSVAIVETTTCKNGKTQAWLHLADVKEPGAHWPDQLEPLVRDAATRAWSLDPAARCKGTGELAFTLSGEPWGDAAARDKWIDEQKRAFSAVQAEKKEEAPHPELAL